jgi:hypothetical protein
MACVRSIASAELPPNLAKVHERFAGEYGRLHNQVAVFGYLPAAAMLEVRQSRA